MLRIILLILIKPVVSDIDKFGAISDGFVHSAIADIMKEPIKNALNPEIVYVCKDSGNPIQNNEKCYTDVLDYTLPPNPHVIFLFNVLMILFVLLFIIFCFTSTVEEKRDVFLYLVCHTVGQIIYDMIHDDDD